MNNLTQTQTDAKQAYLDRQANQMLAFLPNCRHKGEKRRHQANRFVSGGRAE